MVSGPLYDQEEGSPWQTILWHDEQIEKRLIYHYRCAVDFENVPQLSLSRLTWADLDSLNFLNDRGRPILGTQAWGKKLCGNFIQEQKELAKFNELVRFEPPEDAPAGVASVDG